MEEKSSLRWPGPDDRAIVEEMLTNPDSKHWDECCEFIRKFIDIRYSTHPPQLKEEAIQETMLSVKRGLHSFLFKSKFTTWLASIARNRVIDELRKQHDIAQWEVRQIDPPDSHQNEAEIFNTNVSKTPEEELIERERVEEIFAAFEEYINSNSPTKRERNRQILQLVIHEGHNHKETGKMLGVSPPVVGYVVRSANEYARTRIKQKRFHTSTLDE